MLDYAGKMSEKDLCLHQTFTHWVSNFILISYMPNVTLVYRMPFDFIFFENFNTSSK